MHVEWYDEIMDQAVRVLMERQRAALKEAAEQMANSACYRALDQIKRVIDDDRMDDPTCFMRIEEIIHVYEQVGHRCGTRHDFG